MHTPHLRLSTYPLFCMLQMGPSGSGKTTLLDLLAGRKTVGKTEGSIFFAGNKPTRQFLRRYTGYVEQFGGSAIRPPCVSNKKLWPEHAWTVLTAQRMVDTLIALCGATTL